MDIEATTTNIRELSWLSDVKKSGPDLTPPAPISFRHFAVHPGPAVPRPETHPYFELGLHFVGSGVEFVGREQAVREAGDVFLAGPGVPHWFKISHYPLVGTAIYFLPSVLCELGPERDGLQILRRFTAQQRIETRLIRPSPPMRSRLEAGFTAIQREFESKGVFGAEIRSRTLLMEMLVDLLRWEGRIGKDVDDIGSPPQWEMVNQALHYLREHFAEAIYARDVAREIGVSESRLKSIFRDALGVPWSRYMQGYRIQQAIALLGSADRTITEVALSVGFESLSHFNSTFRSFMGVSPSAHFSRRSKKTAAIPTNTDSGLSATIG